MAYLDGLGVARFDESLAEGSPLREYTLDERVRLLEDSLRVGQPVLNADEQEVFDSLRDVMEIVLRRWHMVSNLQEMTAAIHVLQAFAVQHMLHRLAPGSWSNWSEVKATTSEDDEPEGAASAQT